MLFGVAYMSQAALSWLRYEGQVTEHGQGQLASLKLLQHADALLLITTTTSFCIVHVLVLFHLA